MPPGEPRADSGIPNPMAVAGEAAAGLPPIPPDVDKKIAAVDARLATTLNEVAEAGNRDRALAAEYEVKKHRIAEARNGAYTSQAREVYSGFDQMDPADQQTLLEVIHAENDPHGYKAAKLEEACLTATAEINRPDFDQLDPTEQDRLKSQAYVARERAWAGYLANWKERFPNESLVVSRDGHDSPDFDKIQTIREGWESTLLSYDSIGGSLNKFYNELQQQYLANRQKLFAAHPALEAPFKAKFDQEPPNPKI